MICKIASADIDSRVGENILKVRVKRKAKGWRQIMANAFPSISFHIPRFRTGEEAAWVAVCEGFRIGLCSKARQLIGSSAQYRKRLCPEDLVQETFLKVWQHRASFHGDTTPQLAKWMLTILKNAFLDHCRRKNSEHSEEDWRVFRADIQTPSVIVTINEQEAELLAALEKLNPDQQSIIAMKIFEGMSFPEIATRTGININTLGGIYRRGLIRLAKSLHFAPAS